MSIIWRVKCTILKFKSAPTEQWWLVDTGECTYTDNTFEGNLLNIWSKQDCELGVIQVGSLVWGIKLCTSQKLCNFLPYNLRRQTVY